MFAWICQIRSIAYNLNLNQARPSSLQWHLPWNWGRRRLRCGEGGSERGIGSEGQRCILLGFWKWHIQSDQWYRSVSDPVFSFPIFSFHQQSSVFHSLKTLSPYLRWEKSACWRIIRDKAGYMAHTQSHSKGKVFFYTRRETRKTLINESFFLWAGVLF